MTGSTLFAAIILLIAGGIALVVWQTSTLPHTLLSETVSEITRSVEEAIPEPLELKKEIITPPPLRGPQEGEAGQLTAAGVLQETNRHRADNGASALSRNTLLDQAAANKLADMLRQQYFDHISPNGRGPADVVEAAGYEYLRVGENLALGNFESDADLIQAWMDSPGHRENIISSGFTEIGIAVAQGTFDGRRTWLAVQTFGTPEAACPQPKQETKKTIDTNILSMQKLRADLGALAAEIQELTAAVKTLVAQAETDAAQGNALIEQGNAEIERGNETYRQTGSEEEARPYWERGERLQTEGKALIEQAKEKQNAAREKHEELRAAQQRYNTLVDEANAANKAIIQLVKQYNTQVQTFNACVKNFS